MLDQINQLKQQFNTELEQLKTHQEVDNLYLKYFSKSNGLTTILLKHLATMSSEEKREFGPTLNNLQNEQKAAIEQKRTQLEGAKIYDNTIDLTNPVPTTNSGMLHPLTQVVREMNEFFRYYGYSVYDGPDIENADYNFRRLNLPEGHPATDLQDTLFIAEPDILLRTHTSSVEARALTDLEPPIRLVVPGRSFRNETPSATNGAFFHQFQGVVVDKGITIQNMFHTLDQFHRFLFGDDVVLRFRYKYYPEVSPGAGVDMQCKFCKGEGCSVCKYRGWIEMLGCGMIHYNTLKMCGIDPEIYTGFAFGMGLDRIVMQRFKIADLRKLYGGGIVYV
ncbi:MAG: phenylalanine--tRNA ligase subunit alpha [Patescibacteria group bacterium]